MLTQTMMGYLALWILWGNTVLVALAAARRALAISRAAKSFRDARLEDGGAGLFTASIATDGGPAAELRIEQNGRIAFGNAEAIVWHDRAARSRALGGEISIAGQPSRRASLEAGPAEVWLSPRQIEESAACKDAATFADAYTIARRVKGFARTVVASVEPGAQVYVVGRAVEERSEAGQKWTIAPLDGRLIIATIDPRVWARGRVLATLAGFIPAIFACAATCTLLALTAPVFEGLVSKLGAFLGLVFFLVVLPAGVTMRDFLRWPHERFLRGRWVRPTRDER